MRLKSLLVFSILGGVSVWNCWAQTEPAKPGEPRFGNATSTARTLQDYVYGVVKQIDKDALVVDKTPYGDGQSFKLERKTKFIHDGKPSTADALKVGEKVWLDVKVEKKTGEMIAKKVVTGLGPVEVKQ